jgi:DNA helicase-2/ATP-dependent DNA helicase PcrA
VAEDFTTVQPDATLEEFLERVALVSDSDERSDIAERLTLMTIHNAKGLEYPVVFVVGMEDSVFPHHRTLGEPDELEEERRLCYVAMTRAEQRLYLTNAWNRTLFGRSGSNPPSRFLREVPAGLTERRTDTGGPSKRVAGKEALNAADFSVGDRVAHHSFGKGLVLKVSDRPGKEELTVQFDEVGVKRLVLAYASVQRL